MGRPSNVYFILEREKKKKKKHVKYFDAVPFEYIFVSDISILLWQRALLSIRYNMGINESGSVDLSGTRILQLYWSLPVKIK